MALICCFKCDTSYLDALKTCPNCGFFNVFADEKLGPAAATMLVKNIEIGGGPLGKPIKPLIAEPVQHTNSVPLHRLVWVAVWAFLLGVSLVAMVFLRT